MFLVILKQQKFSKMIKNVTLVGAGNLATQLGKSLKENEIEIVQVYSRTETSAKALAEQLGCPFTIDLKELKQADLVIVSVKDDALESVFKQIDKSSRVVHTAGSVPMEILADYFKNHGVFYPLQTFSKQREVDFLNIPICLEASSVEFLQELKQLASRLSQNVSLVNSEKRESLHLAAVFTCNFVNHFYDIGDGLLGEKGLDFSLLKPLIQETAQKVMSLKPIDAQTGPAVRYDETIIDKHLELLSYKPELRKIYSFISRSIYNSKK